MVDRAAEGREVHRDFFASADRAQAPLSIALERTERCVSLAHSIPNVPSTEAHTF